MCNFTGKEPKTFKIFSIDEPDSHGEWNLGIMYVKRMELVVYSLLTSGFYLTP